MFKKRGNTTIILISHWRNENRRHVLFGQKIREKLDAVQIGKEPLSRCSKLSKMSPECICECRSPEGTWVSRQLRMGNRCDPQAEPRIKTGG